LWTELQPYLKERRLLDVGRFYRAHNEHVKVAESVFDQKTLENIWRGLELVFEEGHWIGLVQDASADSNVHKAEKPFDARGLKVVPPAAIEVLEDGWYKWMGYKVQASNFEQAAKDLNTAYIEEQHTRFVASQQLSSLKEAARTLEAASSRDARGDLYRLEHSEYELKFLGRLRQEDYMWFFVEDFTSYKAAAPRVATCRSYKAGRDAITSRDRTLYLAIRSEHAKAKQAKSRATLIYVRNAQIPKEAGDMTHDGVLTSGKLAYRWRDVRVEVTPTRLRPPLDAEGAPRGRRWSQQQAREATPDRALRKMIKKVKKGLAKTARGENERVLYSRL
jgi:hypothetical protein